MKKRTKELLSFKNVGRVDLKLYNTLKSCNYYDPNVYECISQTTWFCYSKNTIGTVYCQLKSITSFGYGYYLNSKNYIKAIIDMYYNKN